MPSDERISLAVSFMPLNERSHAAVHASTARRSGANFTGTFTDELSKISLNPPIEFESSTQTCDCRICIDNDHNNMPRVGRIVSLQSGLICLYFKLAFA